MGGIGAAGGYTAGAFSKNKKVAPIAAAVAGLGSMIGTKVIRDKKTNENVSKINNALSSAKERTLNKRRILDELSEAKYYKTASVLEDIIEKQASVSS
jgi:ligand-binding sensor protein